MKRQTADMDQPVAWGGGWWGAGGEPLALGGRNSSPKPPPQTQTSFSRSGWGGAAFRLSLPASLDVESIILRADVLM